MKLEQAWVLLLFLAVAVAIIVIGAYSWNSRPNQNGVTCEYVTRSTAPNTVIINGSSTHTIQGNVTATTRTQFQFWGDCAP